MAIAIPDGASFSERVVVNAGQWNCMRCAFSRNYATRQGAINGACDMLKRHRVRLIIPESHHETPRRHAREDWP